MAHNSKYKGVEGTRFGPKTPKKAKPKFLGLEGKKFGPKTPKKAGK